MQPLGSVYAALHSPNSPNDSALRPYKQNFLFAFNTDYQEVLLDLQMEFIDLLSSEDSKSKFLACHSLDFCKNHVLLSGWFPNLITHTQQVGLAQHTAVKNEACQEYAAFAIVKSSFIWYDPFADHFNLAGVSS